MFTRWLILCVALVSFSIAKSNEQAKFLVVDTMVYEKIETLNILNGGIKKEYVITSKRLSKDSLKKFYPEYFLYDGPTCYNINKIYLNTKDKNENFDYLKDTKDIKKEIKKIKLLQMLNETSYENVSLSKINDKIIKSIGVLCDDNLFLRGKVYNNNSKIGSYKVKSINMKNASISLEEK